jgi:hypothetical protein
MHKCRDERLPLLESNCLEMSLRTISLLVG